MSAECANCTYVPTKADRRGLTRGLCNPCYSRVHHNGTYIDHPRRLRPLEETIEEWELLRSAGATLEAAAAQLGIKKASLLRALLRWNARQAA